MIVIILAGGSGTRLWPVSRENNPKIFMDLDKSGESLFQKTIKRVVNLKNLKEIIISTNREYFFRLRDECSILNDKIDQNIKITFLLEPVRKNTAASVILANTYIHSHYNYNESVMVFPSDHWIENNDNYMKDCYIAEDLCLLDRLVFFGIKPNMPNTGFGYIKIGEKIGKTEVAGVLNEDNNDPAQASLLNENNSSENVEEIGTNNQSNNSEIYMVEQFVEKPDIEKAKVYVEDGKYFWNSGIFCFSVEFFLKEAFNYCLPLLKKCQDCDKHSVTSVVLFGDRKIFSVSYSEECFSALQDISIDYAIMEKTKNACMIAASFKWNDVGNWGSLQEIFNIDTNGNLTVGKNLLVDTEKSIIYSDNHDKLLACIGVDNMLLVDTKDALLVADKNKTQEVKQLVEKIKDYKHLSYQQYHTVYRPWGMYTTIEETEFYKIKKILVKPKGSLSLQSHKYRCEHWIIIDGIADVVNGEDKLSLKPNECVFIQKNNKHRLSNNQDIDLIVIEIQIGSYFGEDDIVRYDDIYGRIN